jgi:hypothetical protein
VPRRAVCCIVLNLLSQDGSRPNSSALAKAYRVTAADTETQLKGVGPKPVVQHHVHSRVMFLYHNSIQLCRVGNSGKGPVSSCQ